MTTITALFRCALTCLVALASSAAIAAAAPAPAAKATPNTHTVTVGGKTQTYANLPGAPAGGDVGAAYQFRTRISYAANCTRFATDADNVFLYGTMNDSQKVSALQAIQGAAQSAGCLAP